MKKYNWLKVVLISLLVFVLLTWILPTAMYQGSYIENAREQIGIFDLGTYPVVVFMYFGYIGLFVLMVGGLYGILNKTSVYRKLLDSIVDKIKGREAIFLSIVMVLLAVITSVSGLSLGLFVVFPFLISLILLMGYNKLVAASVTVGSVIVGLLGTTYAGNSIGIVNQALSLEYKTEILTKVIILVIGLVLLIFNTLTYAKKVKGAEKIDTDYLPEKKETKKKIWPLVLVFDIMFIVMLLSSITWNDSFGLDIFDTAHKAVMEFEVFGFPIFGKLFGNNLGAFGTWTLREFSLLVFLASVIIAFIYRIRFNEFIESFAKGMKKALYPALLILLIYLCLVVTTYHPFQLVITKAILGITNGFNVVTTSFMAMISSLFNVEMLYTGQSTLPYFISVVTDTSVYPLVGIIYQTIYAVVMLIAPTSAVLVGTLSYLKVPYQDWLKYIWKLLLELIVILFIIFTIILLV